MKKVLTIVIMITLIIAVIGCGKKGNVTDIVVLPSAASNTPSYASPASASTDATVISTVAYVFESSGVTTLYGAAEYRNSSSAPLAITSATFRFNVDGQIIEESFTPPLSEFDIVAPGETSYVTLWLEKDGLSTSFPPVIESVSLSSASTDKKRVPLNVSNIYLADNYPDFTTLSGMIENPNSFECPMNMIYVGFYDERDSLLCVWHFTRNALFEPSDVKSFVIQMKELPVKGLASLCKRTSARAFGFD